MAERKKKTALLSRNPDEPLGWTFWLVAFGVSLIPCVYFSWVIRYEKAPWLFPVGVGLMGAAVCAGLISWVCNVLWQRVLRKRRSERRKQARKAR